jgi:hypothetical protein
VYHGSWHRRLPHGAATVPGSAASRHLKVHRRARRALAQASFARPHTCKERGRVVVGGAVRSWNAAIGRGWSSPEFVLRGPGFAQAVTPTVARQEGIPRACGRPARCGGGPPSINHCHVVCLPRKERMPKRVGRLSLKTSRGPCCCRCCSFVRGPLVSQIRLVNNDADIGGCVELPERSRCRIESRG